jgi:hypothetical protein
MEEGNQAFGRKAYGCPLMVALRSIDFVLGIS